MHEGQAGGEVSVADRGNGMCDCLSGGNGIACLRR